MVPSSPHPATPPFAPPRQNKPGVKCGFCTGRGHDEESCYQKDRA
jgi:hypothetical protein